MNPEKHPYARFEREMARHAASQPARRVLSKAEFTDLLDRRGLTSDPASLGSAGNRSAYEITAAYFAALDALAEARTAHENLRHRATLAAECGESFGRIGLFRRLLARCALPGWGRFCDRMSDLCRELGL